MTSKSFIFPFYIFTFWGRQGDNPWSYVSSGAMRNSDLRSSSKVRKVWVLNWFNAFEGFILNDKTKKVVKAFDLGMISSDF